MTSDQYFGAYERFEAPSKDDSAILLGADNLVGDIFEIEFITVDGVRVAWMKNRFGKRIGYFDHGTSRQLSILEAKGWRLQALLSFIAYSEQPVPGLYWGEAALICFDEAHAPLFDTFTHGIANRMAEGIRPDVALSETGIRNVVESNGTWSPKATIPFPTKRAGTALVKTRRSATEKLVEQGRKRNKGCYAGSIVFFLICAIAIIFGLKTCGVF